MPPPSNHDALRLRRALAGVLAWVAFAAAWVFVLRRPGAVLLSAQVLVIPASAAVVTVLTVWWVRHNRRIYERKGPRRGLPTTSTIPQQDRLGRPVALDLEALHLAREVVVQLDAGGKSYRSAS